jgi:hypothetical protein
MLLALRYEQNDSTEATARLLGLSISAVDSPTAGPPDSAQGLIDTSVLAQDEEQGCRPFEVPNREV